MAFPELHRKYQAHHLGQSPPFPSKIKPTLLGLIKDRAFKTV